MATIKSVFSVLLLVVVAMAAIAQTAHSQDTCSAELTNLNTCAPFVVPGAPNLTPSNACCTSLQQVDHECLCNTLRITARMPALCNLPPVNCAA